MTNWSIRNSCIASITYAYCGNQSNAIERKGTGLATNKIAFADESRKVGQLRPQDMQTSVLGYVILANSRVGRDEPPSPYAGSFYLQANR